MKKTMPFQFKLVITPSYEQLAGITFSMLYKKGI